FLYFSFAVNNLVEGDEGEEEDDLYEPPPNDQSRTPLPLWRPQENTTMYSGRAAVPPAPQKRPTMQINNQNHRQQGAHNVAQWPSKPVPPSKRPLPHPTADRRMSLPCSALRTPPPCVSEVHRGLDDMYVTFTDPQDTGVLGKTWYGGDMDRKEAEKVLRRVNKDGCFLVRMSSAQNHLQPYTLVVLYKEHIYNIPIRSLGARGYSLGKEGKQYEETFPSVAHLIDHYQQEHLFLINRQTQGRESTSLLYPALS
ncbi:SH2 domain-containing protein 6, partial [Spea bombifrons]|uniref:SH2 domain-containing protein 6 n=1 Tax=Spea bombifrons TaxID=233779 RepID=UPI00234A15E9